MFVSGNIAMRFSKKKDN